VPEADTNGARSAWLSDEEQQAWRAYLHGYASLLSRLDRAIRARSGCSLADYEVLVHLSEAADGQLRQFELAEAMRWEKSRLSHHLTRMQHRALLERTPAPRDGRGACITITGAGRRATTRPAGPGREARST
jgi:DNA-binding MarR family transcriptional regulator